MGRLDGKVAIVTGGAEGIGVAYAKALAAEGARVSIFDVIDPEQVCAEIRAAGGVATGHICDVSDVEAVTRSVAATKADFGSVHVLVNNAAVYARLVQIPLEKLTSQEFERALSVNVRGTFECIKACTPIMRAQNYGKIINIASGTAFKGQPFMLHYVASKGAVISLTRSVAGELGADGIRCNCIAPGLVLTDAIQGREGMEGFRRGAAQGRFLKMDQTPQDLCGALIFLASPESDFITGQIMVVDGGSAMH
jgi:NAD(P)-dependent dehydrogenase (short-subunit alcohol dehydrogenase family)